MKLFRLMSSADKNILALVFESPRFYKQIVSFALLRGHHLMSFFLSSFRQHRFN